MRKNDPSIHGKTEWKKVKLASRMADMCANCRCGACFAGGGGGGGGTKKTKKRKGGGFIIGKHMSKPKEKVSADDSEKSLLHIEQEKGLEGSFQREDRRRKNAAQKGGHKEYSSFPANSTFLYLKGNFRRLVLEERPRAPHHGTASWREHGTQGDLRKGLPRTSRELK